MIDNSRRSRRARRWRSRAAHTLLPHRARRLARRVADVRPHCFPARRRRCDPFRRYRRRRAQVAPRDPRVPADARAARHARGDPRSREPRAVGHQHPAVARVRRDGRHARRARRRAHRGLRRSRARREIRRRIRLLPARMGVAVYRPAPQGRLGPVRPVEHRPRREGAHACAARAQFPFLRCAGRAVLHARPRDDVGGPGSTAGCSCKA